MRSYFNLKNYLNLIKYLNSNGYDFINFNKIDDINEKKCEYKILLRHDIDGDLHAAFKMAKLEADQGIFSTYFLMLRSPCYNLMSRSNHDFADNILKLGHDIGLHYDQGFDQERKISSNETSALIQEQTCWLQKQFRCKIHAVSFHQPNLTIIQKHLDCGDLINTYDFKKLKRFQYLSDSNRFLSFKRERNGSKKFDLLTYIMEEVFPKNVQLLIHPMWWVYEEKNTNNVWDKVLENNFNNTQIQLLNTEKAYGSERQFKIVKRD